MIILLKELWFCLGVGTDDMWFDDGKIGCTYDGNKYKMEDFMEGIKPIYPSTDDLSSLSLSTRNITGQ